MSRDDRNRDDRNRDHESRDQRPADPFFDGLPEVGKTSRVSAELESAGRAAEVPGQVPAVGPVLGAAVERTFGTAIGIETGVAPPAGSGAARGHALGGRAFAATRLDLIKPDDRQLIGHEIAHALQQRRGGALTPDALTASLRGALETEAIAAGAAFSAGAPFAVSGAAPPEVALFDDPPRQVVHMTLMAGGLLVLELDNHTRESVRTRFHSQLAAGTYAYDTATRQIVASGPTQAAPGLLEFYPPRDARLDGLPRIPLEVTGGDRGGAHAGHRIQATPQLAVAMPGTRVTYFVGMDPEIGGRYDYHWYCINDPASVGGNIPPRVEGPREGRWENAQWAVPGRHTVVCELTFHGEGVPDRSERLEFFQQVNTEQQERTDAFAQAQAPEYARFRAAVELQNLDLLGGGLPDQRTATGPYIQVAGANPAVPGIAPNLAHNTYTIAHQSPAARKFHWYARCASWDGMPTESYYGFRRVQIDGQDAFELGSDGPSAQFIIASRNRYTIVCDELDAQGLRIGSRATYVQVVESQDQADQRGQWQRYMQHADAAVGKIADGKEVGLRAVYINRETGERVPMQLYAGPDAGAPNRVVLVDLLPGVDRLEYGGDTIEAALNDFEGGNAYPVGSIQLEVPANRHGIPTAARTMETHGESQWSTWSQRVGLGSLLLAGAGVVAALIPGGQPVAAALFIASAATGVAAGGLSLYDRLQKAEKSPLGIALDVAGIAASVVGGATAFRALRVGTALTFTGTAGRFLFYAGFATNAVAGLLITVEGIDEISRVLDSEMPRGEKIGAIVRILTTLIIQGALLALTVRDVNQMRGRIGGLIGEEAAGALQIDVLHSLNLLDDDALRALRGMPSSELSTVAELARLNPRIANRLAVIAGTELAERRIVAAQEAISIEGQIRIDPAKLAAMSDAEIRDVIRASRLLAGVGGDISQLSEADQQLVRGLTSSTRPGGGPGLRLRFEGQLDQGARFVEDLGATRDPRGRALFAEMTDRDRARLFDLVNSDRPSGTTGALDRQASDWALSRRPATVGDYVNYFEMYLQQFRDAMAEQTAAYQARVQAAINGGQSRQQAEAAQSTALFGEPIQGTGRQFRQRLAAKLEADFATTGAGVASAAYDANAAALAGRTGASRVGAAQSEAEAVARLRAVPEMRFSSESAAVYHVDKHVGELPPSEAPAATTPAARVNAYLRSATETVHTGTVTAGVNQDGTRTLTFTRTVTEGGRTYSMQAIVVLTDDGNAFLATYFNTGRR